MYQIRSIPINYNRVKLLFELRLKILLKLHEAINKFMSDYEVKMTDMGEGLVLVIGQKRS